MKARKLTDVPERTFVLVFETGDEVMTVLQRFAQENALTACSLRAIGAFESAVVGYFDWERKEYLRIPVDEQVQVLSLLGDIALDGDTPKVHLHAVLGRRDGSTVGGHLLEAHVRPTLEVIASDAPTHLRRRFDAASGISLIDPTAR
ncbi:hypothetical protein SAMN05216359_11818 [Roseateles sp. YR242]|uniref:PPC domain-containing DNA-binding protein n=1 Tax=Roseateles sp. YR242 TaxID=1855305 RepID=UPI0008C4AE9E|nr:PPC domain-containing DNA-binding protein [Roseateles sp. YR242]SEL81679.1 hypothetical protein SAMN05216359_11818 [Roseateles sp. YR242]